jgi:hypothetical protein
MADAAAAVAAKVVTILGSGWTYGTNVFSGPMRAEALDIPREAVFCREGGGPKAMMRFGGGGNIREQRVLVYVRGAGLDTMKETRDRAHQIWEGLMRATISGFISSVCEGEPIFLEMMPTDVPVWTVSVMLWLQQ